MRSVPALIPLLLMLVALSSSPGFARPPAGTDAEQGEPAPPGKSVGLDDVGSGELLARTAGGLVPLPMLDLAVDLQITGMMVRGAVTQSFRNPTGDVIEAIYVFPLPERAAIHHMEMRIGPDRIVAVIREKEEARQTYEKAKAEGRKASLVEQQRPNLFTTSAANVNPGERVDVVLEYLQELPYDDGEFRLLFPLTFTPRFGSCGAGDGAALAAGARPSPMAAYPRARISARLSPGMPLQNDEAVSPSHGVSTWWDGDELVVETREETVAADRDFLLAWRPLLGWEPSTALFAEERGDGRYLLMMLLPPEDGLGAGRGLPTETLFIVDVSGSMQGPSMAQARLALIAALDRLRPGDSFNILTFSDEVTEYRETFLPAEPDHVREAQRWVRGLDADGGTRIDLALAHGIALSTGRTDGPLRRIIFLTDGAVGDEDEVLRMVLQGLGPVRLHTLGIGAAPNRYLLRKMAEHGRGLCDFIATPTGAENRVDAFLARLQRPVLRDLRLEWDGAAPEEVYPAVLPDLHAGEPIYLSARMPPGASPAGLRLLADTADGPASFDAALTSDAPEDSGVATRWARAKVGSLMDSLHAGADPGPVRREVVDVSLLFGILTPYTSLVAVEDISTAEGEAIPVRLVPGALPTGGTLDPLWLRLALLLTAAGAALLIVRPRT